MWSKLQRYAQLQRSRKRLLWEALGALALARLAMACLPFRRIAAWLGTAGEESPFTATEEQILRAKEVGWAVSTLAKHVPWDSRCLAQALAASGMLRRRGFEGTVSFGVDRKDSKPFTAHAWLRFGPVMVTGEAGHEQYKILTRFARRSGTGKSA